MPRSKVKRAILKKLQIGKKPILVVGNQRTGTSWLGSTLGRAPEALFYHEPCNPKVNGKGHDLSIKDRYVPTDVNDLQLSTLLDEAFLGLPCLRMFWEDKRWRRLLPGYRIVIKEVVTMINIEWIYNRYKPSVIIITRHPRDVIMSDLTQGEEPNETLKKLLEQPRLVEDHLKPYLKKIDSLTSIFEKMAAIWGIRHRVLANFLSDHPESHVVFYEEMCRNPVEYFCQLYKILDLKWTEKVRQYLIDNTTKHTPGTYAVSRVTSRQLSKWKRGMTKSQLEKVHDVIRCFDLPFFRDDQYWSLTED